jgi:SAM-dependent methyltransferase
MNLLSSVYNIWFDTFTIDFFHILTRRRLKKVGLLFRGEILDIGCGKKPYKSSFPNCTHYRGTNSASYYKVAGMPSETDLVVDDGCDLPVQDNSIENIVNFQVLPVFEDMNRFFSEAWRVLKPGGYFLLTSDFLYPIWNAPFNFWRTTGFGLEKLAEINGFETVVIIDYGGFWNMLGRVFPRYLRGQLFNFLTSYRQEKRLFFKLLKMIRVICWFPITPLLPFLGDILLPLFALLECFGSDKDFSTNYLILMRKPD